MIALKTMKYKIFVQTKLCNVDTARRHQMRHCVRTGLVSLIAAVIFAAAASPSEAGGADIEMVFQTGNGSEICCLAFNADSTRIFSGSDIGDIVCWDIKTGRQVRSFSAPGNSRIRDMRIEPDNRMLRVFTGNNDIFFVDTKSGIIRKTFHSKTGELCIYMKDGKYVLSRDGKKLVLADIGSDRPASVLYEHDEHITNVISSGNNRYIVFCDYKGRCFILDTSAARTAMRVNFPAEERIQEGIISPDGRSALLSGNKNMYMVSLPDGTADRIMSPASGRIASLNSPMSAAFSRDGKTIFFKDGFKYDITSKKAGDAFKFRYDSTVACSPDGRYVVYASDVKGSVAASKSNVISVYNAETTKLVTEMTGNSVTAQSSSCVTPDGHYLITGGQYENFLRVWDLKNAMLAARLQTGELMGWVDLRISPDGKKISAMKAGTLYCFSAENWRLLAQEPFGRETRYAWFPDSERIAVVRVSGLKGRHAGEIYALRTGKRVTLFDGDFPGANDVAVSPDGKLVAVAETSLSKPSIRLLRTDSGATAGTMPGLKYSIHRIMFTDDGKKIIGKNSEGFREWNISDGSFRELPGGARFFVKLSGGRLCVLANGIFILNQDSGVLSPTVIDAEFVRENLALAANGFHHPSAPVIFFPCGDGAIRMVNYETGKMTVFCGSKTNADWLIFNNDGYWDANGGGSSMVAARKGDAVYAIDQFAIEYNRPDRIIADIPGGEPAAVSYFKSEYERRCRRMGIDPGAVGTAGDVPEIRDMSVTRNGNIATVSFRIVPNGTVVSRYSVYVNGVPVFGAEGKKTGGAVISEKVALTTGANRIEVSCFTAGGAESIRAAATEHLDETILGNLYFIGFGVSVYKDESLRLKYADKDIRNLSAALSSVYGTARYRPLVLTNEEVTADAADKAKAFLSSARPEDVVILAIAGHGVHDSDKGATYYFLPHAADLGNLSGSAMNFEKIESILQGIAPRKKLFLMDTCESGESEPSVEAGYLEKARERGVSARTTRAVAAVKKKNRDDRSLLLRADRFIFSDLLRRSGAIVFSSCRGNEFSYEQDEIGNGFFTRSIIDALSGKADTDRNRSVSISELRKYVEDDVARKTGDLQHPTIDRDNFNMPLSFPFARP